MAATTSGRTIEPLAGKSVSKLRVTLTGVTTYTWATGLHKVDYAGFTIVSGTGQGDCLAATTMGGSVVYGGVTAMTAGDVLDLFAVGDV